jgi:hypothetical protein
VEVGSLVDLEALVVVVGVVELEQRNACDLSSGYVIFYYTVTLNYRYRM